MTTTRIFKSTDTSAPVLTGQTGSLVALLHACLVGTSGVAYGSGGTAKTAAGWSEPFTNLTTKGVFKNSAAAGGSGCCVRILDDGSLASTFKEATLITYQSMTDLDTGVQRCPDTTQLASGCIVRKSTTADGTARAWTLVADEITFYLHIQANASTLATGGGEWGLYGGGDFNSEVPSDAYRYFAMGRTTINITSASEGWPITQAGYSAVASPGVGLYLGRSYLGTGIALSPAIIGPGTAQTFGNGGMADPAVGSSVRYYVPVTMVAESMIRGWLRGMYYTLNSLTTTVTAPASVSGAMGLPSGSVLQILPWNSSGGVNAFPCIESAVSW